MPKFLIWCVTTMLVSRLCEGYKILVVFPFPSTSHSILGDGVVRHLLAAGHEVTYITPFPKPDLPSRLQQVDVSSNKKTFPHVLNIKMLLDKKVNLKDQTFVFKMMLLLLKDALAHENVQALIHDSNQHFDAVIPEWMFSDPYCGFAAVFNCPCIWFYPFEHFTEILSLIDEMPNAAYTTSMYSCNNIPPFTFLQRLESLWFQITFVIYKKFYYFNIENEIYVNAFASSFAKKGRAVPAYDEVRRNVSLVLVNTHTSMGQSMSVPPNYINIGGYHVASQVEPLPDNLKKIMDEAKTGVIFFSMGSNMKSKEFPDELKMALLKMFSGLKQTVLWKFEDVLTELPRNVHVLQWAPQPSILAHPNCVLFITHGGLLSTTEAVHFGVPVIGIPAFADQFLIVDQIVTKGFAKRVDLSYAMVDDLREAIDDIISDHRYAEKAKEVSHVYHDRVASPGAELVHWVEHVVRTRGAPHLRSPALHVPLYQKMYLDLIALVITLIFIAKHTIKRLYQLCCKANKTNVAKKKK